MMAASFILLVSILVFVIAMAIAAAVLDYKRKRK